MKTSFIRCSMVVCVLLALGLLNGHAAEEAEAADSEAEASAGVVSGKARAGRVVVEELQPAMAGEKASREVAWLGLATEEASEALAAQLGLKAGEGLVVTYVASDSPASKAGLKRNDLLVEFEGQVLIHPAQFRKLVQMQKEGDSVKLIFYRSGNKEDVSVKLGKTTLGWPVLRDENAWGSLRDLQRQFGELAVGERVQEEVARLRQSLAEAGVDRKAIETEIKRSVEEAQKAIAKALRQATNAHRTFGPAVRQMQEIVRRGVDVDKDASIIVKSHRNEVKTMVKTDESGTYVIVSTPAKRLTAHDKAGKLVFDGEIESPEQQERLPKAIREKVQPMLDEMEKDVHEHSSAENHEGI